MHLKVYGCAQVYAYRSGHMYVIVDVRPQVYECAQVNAYLRVHMCVMVGVQKAHGCAQVHTYVTGVHTYVTIDVHLKERGRAL